MKPEITVTQGPKTIAVADVIGYSVGPDGAVDRFTATRWVQDGEIYYCPVAAGQPVVAHTRESMLEASRIDKWSSREGELRRIVSWLRGLGRISEQAKHLSDMLEREAECRLPNPPRRPHGPPEKRAGDQGADEHDGHQRSRSK